MATVEIYTTKVCPYCVRAKSLLNAKDVDFIEHDLSTDDAGREALLKKTNGMRTVPQIFINGQHVGGCDDLYALEKKGELDKMLAG
jgi:glutaredoxin 3